MPENYGATSEQTRQMKIMFASHLEPFSGGYLQIPLLPSSSNSAVGKELQQCLLGLNRTV